MLLLRDLDLLERAPDPTSPEHWTRVDRLADGWRRPALPTAEPVELPDPPAVLAPLPFQGRAVCAVGTAAGLVGLVDLSDAGGVYIGELRQLTGFNTTTDEVRAIVAGPRRFSDELDLFITGRRWNAEAKPPDPLTWRAVCWLDGEGRPRFRPVAECATEAPAGWPPLAGPAPRLPAWLYGARLHDVTMDPLAEAHLRQLDALASEAELAAATEGAAVAVDPDGKLTWVDLPPGLESIPPSAEAAALVAHDGAVELLATWPDGRVRRYRPGAAAQLLEVDGTPTAMAVFHVDGGLDLLVATQDRRLTRWRWVGEERLKACWSSVVEERARALPTPAAWDNWTTSGTPRPGADACQLLWLHAAWSQGTPLAAFCANVRRQGRHHRATRVGQEVAQILAASAHQEDRDRALEIYLAGGLSLREQVDRSRPTKTSDRLWRRAMQNDWDLASKLGDPEQPQAVANLATRTFVHEATWNTGATWVAVAEGHLFVAGSTGVRTLPVPDDEGIAQRDRESEDPLGPVWSPSDRADVPTWRWARSLHDGARHHLVAFGGDRGSCVVATVWQHRPIAASLGESGGFRTLGAMPLGPPGDGAATIGLLLAEGPRTYVDEVRVTRERTGLGVAVDRRHQLPVPALRADVAWLDGRRILAVSTRTHRVDLLEFDDANKTYASFELESPTVELRFATTDLPHASLLLVLVTEDGSAWCFDVGRRAVAWVHHTQGAITSLDVTGRGSDLEIAICSVPHLVTVLDAEGRRRWRHGIGQRPAALAILPRPDHGTCHRLAVVDSAGRLSLYRRAGEEWAAKARALPSTGGDRVRAARAIGLGQVDEVVRVDSAEPLRQPEARRAALGDLAARGNRLVGLPADLDVADIAAIARELSSTAPLPEWEALWERALRLLDDWPPTESITPAEEMVGELFSHLRRRGTAFSFVCERVADLEAAPRARVTGPSASLPLCHTWIDALWQTTPVGLDRELRALHTLPPRFALHLGPFVPEHALAELLTTLSQLGQGKAADVHHLRHLAESANGGPTRAALLSALDAACAPAWSASEALINASRQVPPGPGPWVAALRLPAARVPPGEAPNDTWRLDRQSRWLKDLLGRRHRLDLSAPDLGGPWGSTVRRLFGDVEHGFRAGVLERLTSLVSHTRTRLAVRVLPRVGEEVVLGIELGHEGALPLDKVEIDLEVIGTPVRWAWKGERLGPEDPPVRDRLPLPASTGPTAELRVTTRAAGAEVDTTTWPVTVGPRRAAPARESILVQVGPLWERLRREILAVRNGVAILVLDEPLNPGAVVTALLDLPDTDVVDVDGPLAGVPDAELDLQMLLRVLGGHDPLDHDVRFSAGQLPREGGGRVIASPCTHTAERLLGGKPGGTWAALRDILRGYASAGRTPALVLVLPSALASAKFAELADAGARLIHPAIVAPPMRDLPELVQALAVRLGVGLPEGAAELQRVGGDLRRVAEPVGADEATRWLRGDVTGVSAADLVALLALVRARAQVRSADVQPWMSVVESSRGKGRAGGGPMVTIAALRQLDLAASDETPRQLLGLVGFDDAARQRLVRWGFLFEHGELAWVRPDLAALACGRPGVLAALEQLRERRTLWQAVKLDRLVNKLAARALLEELGIDKPVGLPLDAVGHLWRGDHVSKDAVAQIVQAFVEKEPLASVEEWSPVRAKDPTAAVLELPAATGGVPVPWTLVLLPRGARAPVLPGRQLIVVLGPEPDLHPPATTVSIGEGQIREILGAADSRRAFWAIIQTSARREKLTPFVHNAALPPGSRLFVGRAVIRRSVANHLLERSTLLLGARQVGKTSLLHQLYHDAQERTDILPALVDAQGRDTPENLDEPIRRELQRLGVADLGDGADALLDAFEEHGRIKQRLPVLFVNEIDGLLARSPAFVERLRGRHERGRMRFVFVGYATARWEMDRPGSPLFHFTQAESGRAYYLGPLEPPEAEALLAHLEAPPLGFQWADGHRALGLQLLREHAYDVAWVLQELCQSLVARLQQARRVVLEVDDVRAILASRRPLLDQIESYDLAAAMGRSGHGGRVDGQSREGGRLILSILVWQLYFPSGQRPSVRGLLLGHPQPTFTVDEARRALSAAVCALPLLPDEAARVQAWLEHVPLHGFLIALTLTLVLAPAQGVDTVAWTFQRNLYPVELLRAEQRGRSVEDRVLEQARRLLDLL